MIISGGLRYHPGLAPLLEPIERVRPHPENPNNGDVDAIEVSIEVNGMYRPVEAQVSTGFILAGNTTYTACLALDADRIPVVWLDVDDEAALRILLGDNQLARLARIDHGLLAPQLDRLMETELRLLGTGYAEPPPPPPVETEYSYTVTVRLTGETMAMWFDIPGEDDRGRLLWLIGSARG